MTTSRRPYMLAITLLSIVVTPVAMAAQPGMTYESLKDLPDFAGSWTPRTPPFELPPANTQPTAPPAPTSPAARADLVCRGPGVIRPEAVSSCRAFMADMQATRPGDRSYCTRQPFTGQPPRGAGGAIEILFTPGQVTLSVESGLVRRIYVRDQKPAGALDESFSGTSIAHWEDETLVVDTTGLDPRPCTCPASQSAARPLCKNGSRCWLPIRW